MTKLLNWFLLILFLAVTVIAVMQMTCSKANADDKKLFFQKSQTDPRKTVIVKGDKAEGYLQKSPVDPRRTIQYDKDGNEQGYWQQSPIDPRKTIYHEKE